MCDDCYLQAYPARPLLWIGYTENRDKICKNNLFDSVALAIMPLRLCLPAVAGSDVLTYLLVSLCFSPGLFHSPYS